MNVFKARLRRLRHVLIHTVKGGFGKHSMKDYVIPSKVFPEKIKFFTRKDRVAYLDCSCGKRFYDYEKDYNTNLTKKEVKKHHD